MWLQHSSTNPGGRTAGAGWDRPLFEVGGLQNHEPCAKFNHSFLQSTLKTWGLRVYHGLSFQGRGQSDLTDKDQAIER